MASHMETLFLGILLIVTCIMTYIFRNYNHRCDACVAAHETYLDQMIEQHPLFQSKAQDTNWDFEDSDDEEEEEEEEIEEEED
jgi:hypothetical protein